LHDDADQHNHAEPVVELEDLQACTTLAAACQPQVQREQQRAGGKGQVEALPSSSECPTSNSASSIITCMLPMISRSMSPKLMALERTPMRWSSARSAIA